MTREDLYHTWLLIELWAMEDGVKPAQVRERIKAAIAKRWKDEEEYGIRELQTLHAHFSSPPSVESVLVHIRDLATENFWQ